MKKRLWFVVSAVVDSGDDTPAEAILEEIGVGTKASIDVNANIVIDIVGESDSNGTLKIHTARFVDVFEESPV